MTDDIDVLAGWVEPLLKKMEPYERRNLMKSISRDLRKSNQERMKKQESPDGQKWQPRKARKLRGKSGGIRKKAMFTKIRTAKHLKIRTTPDVAGLSFVGIAGRIAAIHHHGLRARVDRDGPDYDYPQRRLLGISREDLDMIADKVLEHVTL
ncbi:phage virion morphogenesis protein [Marinobacter sp. X15-166B]|uniref:phage virion morphogenesis protein n=1 Tax=Marinobacter sp. X15-166B TaxID=1897620 RepID=UPI00085CAF8D|nr:phage virion morphogenesis protein [Marinobacter sp. X15-166B]OEY67462.1 phage virion morphogenesis protein [Marinobacter sp. X15-166B]